MKPFVKYILFLAIIGNVRAQASTTIIEAKSPFFPNETRFTTEILGLGEDFVFPHWQKYLEEHGGISQLLEDERGNLQMITEHVEFPPLQNEKVTLKTIMAPNAAETGVDLSISVKQQDGTYLSSENKNEAAIQSLKNWMLHFNRNLRTLEKEEVFNPVIITKEKNNT